MRAKHASQSSEQHCIVEVLLALHFYANTAKERPASTSLKHGFDGFDGSKLLVHQLHLFGLNWSFEKVKITSRFETHACNSHLKLKSTTASTLVIHIPKDYSHQHTDDFAATKPAMQSALLTAQTSIIQHITARHNCTQPKRRKNCTQLLWRQAQQTKQK